MQTYLIYFSEFLLNSIVFNLISNSDSNNTGFIMTLIYGIAGGILSLVGILAFFISINIQPVIQNQRDLWLKMQELSNKLDIDDFNLNTKLASDFVSKYKLYKKLDSSRFWLTMISIVVCIIAIAVACYIWFMGFKYLGILGNLNSLDLKISYKGTILGIITLVLFCVLLSTLLLLKRISGVPVAKDLIDSKMINQSNIDTIRLSAWCMKLEVVKGTLLVNSDIPFRNVHIIDKENKIIDPIGEENKNCVQTWSAGNITDIKLKIKKVRIALFDGEKLGYELVFDFDSCLKKPCAPVQIKPMIVIKLGDSYTRHYVSEILR
ncbi:hypothetical protein [Salirhabdus salicampi]|uniref:hypothetical protein n=1 Tax=Salirhabdus salicampi TaxID=476102 RepID=UPI0020C3A4DB|nr:hypothetical protein [Salirhabdus salicampi]MCP8615241.1 hypothetical protein [Salirhabdus salicampi]